MDLKNRPRAGRRGLEAIGLVIIASVAVGGCASSSSLVNLWKDPEGPPHPLHDMLVVSMSSQQVMRRVWEDEFVAELGKRGVRATPSYRLYPDAPPDTADLIQSVSAQNFDGVISIHRLPTEQNVRYVPGYMSVAPYERVGPWTGYYHTHYVETYTPGHTETDQIVRYEVDVWSPTEERALIWSGITETINPSSSDDVNREVSRLIVPELGESGVLAKSKT